MKNDIKLFINNELVDYSNELSIPFVYQLEDVNNPSIIKNHFTKTISIIGTKQNNKIFGDIYNFDREQLYNSNYLTGAYFNPSQRTPFTIYRDGELIESGYMQLNTISIKNKVINYQITLYGGIGDFFYSLSYNDNNEPLTLSDLVYGVKDDNGNTLDAEKEMDMVINKETVKRHWDNVGLNDGKIEDFITFIPAYNGLYENFDSNKAIINTHNSKVFPQQQITDGEDIYNAYNGYALGEWDNEVTEWEFKDLRSYQQRPSIKLKKVVEACCNPINNGGYNVELDNSFFNENNPYWEKAYIALPMLSSLITEKEDVETTINPKLQTSVFLGSSGNTYNAQINYHLSPNGENFVEDALGFFSTENFSIGSTISINLDFQLFFKSEHTNRLFLSTILQGNIPQYQSITAQILVYSADEVLHPIAKSNIYNFTNKLSNGKYSNSSVWTNYINLFGGDFVNVFGNFEYDTNSKTHYFRSDEGSNTFRITVDNIPKYNKLKAVLLIERRSDFTDNNNSLMYATPFVSTVNIPTAIKRGYWLTGIDNKSTLSVVSNNNGIGGEMKINKNILLKTDKSPADYLLSYTKLFNLHFIKDTAEKKIKILTRQNYFKDEVIDWSDRIDWSNEVNINPILFNKKFYMMALNGSNYYLDKYKNDYSVGYGQKRINTNYNFNSEIQPIFEDNVYENSISILDKSGYYKNFYNNSNILVPAFAVEGLTYKLFKNVASTNFEMGTIEIDKIVSLNNSVAYNSNSGYDNFAKCCFFKFDNNKKTLSDINSSLVFYNGNITPKDINGKEINYWLTDDISEMGLLNDGKPCYLYTEGETDKNGNKIACKISSMPQFIRYNIVNNIINHSWDFAVPKEIYIPNTTYDEKTTIYNRFWGDFYKDQLDINTKKITCNVNLQGIAVNNELLRKFYYFGNSLWILNKIDNYDINSNKTTKCEFIKVNEQYSYLKPIVF